MFRVVTTTACDLPPAPVPTDGGGSAGTSVSVSTAGFDFSGLNAWVKIGVGILVASLLIPLLTRKK